MHKIEIKEIFKNQPDRTGSIRINLNKELVRRKNSKGINAISKYIKQDVEV